MIREAIEALYPNVVVTKVATQNRKGKLAVIVTAWVRLRTGRKQLFRWIQITEKLNSFNSW